MIDIEKVNTVMNMTGVELETARAALITSDGDVDIAVRIIHTYHLRDDATVEASNSTNGQDENRAGGQGEQTKAGDETPLAGDILDAIKDIWKKGNASRLDIEKEGKTLLSISLTIGTIGLILAPVAALIGIGAALITDYKIIITLDNGTQINVNEFAVTHKKRNG